MGPTFSHPADVARVTSALSRDGWVVLRGVDGMFDAIARCFGEPIDTTSVRLVPGVGTYLCEPAEVPLHTDHPDVDVIGWLCEAQDAAAGANVLIDAWASLSALGPRAEVLRSILLPYPPILPGRAGGWREVVAGPAERPRVYFAPWHAARATGSLESLIAALRAAPRIEIRLAPGDALFVDNHRVLHGRGPIAADSPRRLRRTWLARKRRIGSSDPGPLPTNWEI